MIWLICYKKWRCKQPEERQFKKKDKSREKLSHIKRGGFGEPYCSDECYDKGGKYAAAVMLKKQSGVCGFCKRPVQASMYGVSNCAIVPYEGVNLFICDTCVKQGQEYLRKYGKCCSVRSHYKINIRKK
jgi:hypothetical protein